MSEYLLLKNLRVNGKQYYAGTELPNDLDRVDYTDLINSQTVAKLTSTSLPSKTPTPTPTPAPAPTQTPNTPNTKNK